ncbi:hypothetical protein [Streptomyces cinereoruber]|uniref:Uncharacterized protein n=1 Tax=Streptomyces cinereoruber TaxID=67260 RepID=A0ABX6B9B4_9ACTN|nr:hypothetical protein [Streptomyces cinereoruber]MBB4161650.1 hypothetical protein [Streptomyces cinereoruber]MBY8820434.1 hypothetical protein [Streptomyces cinereoruber]QEV30912.1 hypothetical protein CP977_00810 [Streptomyces cinereoruber]
MSLLASLLRVRAAATGHAQPACRLRHLPLSQRPLMMIVLNRTGPTARPLTVMLGTDPYRPQLHTAPPSGNNTPMLASLADTFLTYIDTCHRAGTAPQILVPNTRSVQYLKHLGTDLRLRRTDDQAPHSQAIQRLGHWLTYATDRAEVTGTSALIPLTGFLAMHWITGQSPLEDEDLTTLLAWIDPPRHTDTGRDAAAQAEDAAPRPLTGPATDADFDNEELAPLFHAHTQAWRQNQDQASVLQELHHLLNYRMQPTWDRMWHAYSLLTAIPEAPSTPSRWEHERTAFTEERAYLAQDGRPRPAQDHVIAAARHLTCMEHAARTFAAQRAAEDPFTRAELRTTGEAFGGPVTTTDERHTQPGPTGRTRWRPRFTIATQDPVLMEPGQLLASHTHRKARYRICTIQPTQHATLVELEITAGMGTANRPNHSVLPEAGAQLLFTCAPDHYLKPQLPARDQTPWTHGGPPVGPPDRDEKQP